MVGASVLQVIYDLIILLYNFDIALRSFINYIFSVREMYIERESDRKKGVLTF